MWTFIFEILFLHETLNLWSLAGTALILGYMMIVGIIKVIESGKHTEFVVEKDEEGLLLESHTTDTGGYGATEEHVEVDIDR